jgi:hypothetical protein
MFVVPEKVREVERTAGDFHLRHGSVRRLGAQEFCVKGAAGEEEFVEAELDVGLGEARGLVLQHALGGAAHEFFNEGGGDAVGLSDDVIGDSFIDGNAAGVKRGEFSAACIIGQRKFNRLINAPGTSGQSDFEFLGTIGGEHEENGGIFTETIHFVEEFVEQAFGAGAVHAGTAAGDQIGIFDDEDRGLQKARERKVFFNEADLLGGDEQRGVVGNLAGEIMNSVGLAGAGRAVEEQSFFEAEAKARELFAMPDELGNVAFEQGQGFFRKNDFVTGNAAKFVNANGRGFAGVGAAFLERENASAVRAAFGDDFFRAGHDPAGEGEAILAGRNGDLDADAFRAAVLFLASEQKGKGSCAVAAEPKDLLQAPGWLVVTGVDLLVLERADENGVIFLHPKFGEDERVVPPLLMQTDETALAVLGNQLVESFLEFDLRGHGKSARGGDEFVEAEAGEVAFQGGENVGLFGVLRFAAAGARGNICGGSGSHGTDFLGNAHGGILGGRNGAARQCFAPNRIRECKVVLRRQNFYRVSFIISFRQRFAKLSARGKAGWVFVLMLGVLALGAGWVARVEPRSRMTVGLRSVDRSRGTAVLVLTNATTNPASILLTGVEILSNGVWMASTSVLENRGRMVLLENGTLTVHVYAPTNFRWRVRFTSVEKNSGMSAVGYRVRLFFEAARSGFANGFDFLSGEVYHDLELVSEEIPAIEAIGR